MEETDILEELSSIVGKGKIAMPSNITMPPVEVIENGHRVANPRIDPSVMNFLMLASIASQEVKIRKALEKEVFNGEPDTRHITATDMQGCIDLVNEYPYNPWINAFVINDGPDTVYLKINKPDHWIEIRDGETRTIDHAHAEKRIEQIYYKCDAGETASVRAEGQY